MVTHCQAEARRIIWDLRTADEVTDSLSQALQRTLSVNPSGSTVQTSFDLEGVEIPLAPSSVHHLVCIGQEAVSNAMRHAEASRITIRLRYETDALSLSIRDNGRGFQGYGVMSDGMMAAGASWGARAGHFGIAVMEERARKLGGSFKLQSSAGAGTEVIVRVAFHAVLPPQVEEPHFHPVDRDMSEIRVLLIEDHFLARMALHSVLAGHPQIVVVGEAADGEAGIVMYRTMRPDVVVLDLRLPRLSGFEVIVQIRKEFSEARIVILSNYQGSEDIYRAVRDGAMAYLTKDASGEELHSAILSVHRGRRYLPRLALDRLAERMPAVDLTRRESEVLVCITQGRSNKEIAEELQIAEKTVRIHVSAVLEKMGARDRTQATIYALQRGLVHFD